MNNFKKVGLTALAGSLVAFSAHAGELTVTGGANATYKWGKDATANHCLLYTSDAADEP